MCAFGCAGSEPFGQPLRTSCKRSRRRYPASLANSKAVPSSSLSARWKQLPSQSHFSLRDGNNAAISNQFATQPSFSPPSTLPIPQNWRIYIYRGKCLGKTSGSLLNLPPRCGAARQNLPGLFLSPCVVQPSWHFSYRTILRKVLLTVHSCLLGYMICYDENPVVGKDGG